MKFKFRNGKFNFTLKIPDFFVEKYQINHVSYLNHGTAGVAFLVNEDTVMKATNSFVELKIAGMISRMKDKPKNIVEYFDAVKLKDEKWNLIFMERLYPCLADEKPDKIPKKFILPGCVLDLNRANIMKDKQGNVKYIDFLKGIGELG